MKSTFSNTNSKSIIENNKCFIASPLNLKKDIIINLCKTSKTVKNTYKNSVQNDMNLKKAIINIKNNYDITKDALNHNKLSSSTTTTNNNNKNNIKSISKTNKVIYIDLNKIYPNGKTLYNPNEVVTNNFSYRLNSSSIDSLVAENSNLLKDNSKSNYNNILEENKQLKSNIRNKELIIKKLIKDNKDLKNIIDNQSLKLDNKETKHTNNKKYNSLLDLKNIINDNMMPNKAVLDFFNDSYIDKNASKATVLNSNKISNNNKKYNLSLKNSFNGFSLSNLAYKSLNSTLINSSKSIKNPLNKKKYYNYVNYEYQKNTLFKNPYTSKNESKNQSNFNKIKDTTKNLYVNLSDKKRKRNIKKSQILKDEEYKISNLKESIDIPTCSFNLYCNGNINYKNCENNSNNLFKDSFKSNISKDKTKENLLDNNNNNNNNNYYLLIIEEMWNIINDLIADIEHNETYLKKVKKNYNVIKSIVENHDYNQDFRIEYNKIY